MTNNEREPVIPDQVYHLKTTEEDIYLSPVYDKIDFFPGFGHYILKVYREDEMEAYHITEDAAKQINKVSLVPYAIREDMHQSEYEGYLTFKASQLDDDWLDL